ncbi:geranylgeranyl diphosphate synthase [Apiospora rasikravindrae]|uniref:Geranylgeranyl diphosphate synthase n=1 Tax=Apiospora rasikravindrae TaxID=990691 RepID=A0ABR1S3C5_9PEZI
MMSTYQPKSSLNPLEGSSPANTDCNSDELQVDSCSPASPPSTAPSETADHSELLRATDQVQKQWAITRAQVGSSPHSHMSTPLKPGFVSDNALNHWFACPQDTVVVIKRVIGMLHNSSLVQDNSTLRRGKPATHTVFGAAQSVNSAAYVIIQAVSEIQRFFGPASAARATGKGLPLIAFFLGSRVSIELTGGLARDDIDAVRGTGHGPYTSQKGFCEDLDEGKYSLVLIHALQNADDTGRPLLESMLSMRRTQGKLTVEQKLLMLGQIRTCGSLGWTGSLLDDLHRQTVAEICSLEEVFGRENHDLRALADMLQRRG